MPELANTTIRIDIPTSCGTLIFNKKGQMLLCHVTGTNHWDIPKGMQEPGESTLHAAKRELMEETLAAKASNPGHIQIQREVARKTVREFVEKWLITQGKWEADKSSTVRVFLANEFIGSMSSTSLAISR
jgi:ADP-ribose pyrophosphatase YjhB (NUDIX family)